MHLAYPLYPTAQLTLQDTFISWQLGKLSTTKMII